MIRSRNITAALALMLPTLWLIGCVEDISLDTGEAPKVVVNCLLTEGDVQTMELFYTSEARDGARRPVTDAEVILSSFDEEVSRFHYDFGCVWSARFTPKCGTLYKMKIITEGDTLSAQTRFPDNLDIGSYFKLRYSDTTRRYYYLFYSYEVRYFSYAIDTYPWTTPDDVRILMTYGVAYTRSYNLWIFPHNLGRGDYENYIGTTHQMADNFNLSSLFVADLPCFSRDSVLAMRMDDIRRELGWYPAIYPDLQLHDKLVRIPVPANYESAQSQKELTGTPVYSPRAFVLVREFPITYEYNKTPMNINLYDFYLLSDEADRYFKDVYARDINKDNFLFEYDTDNIYTNVEGGGLGVFGAYIVRNVKRTMIGYYDDNLPDYVYPG